MNHNEVAIIIPARLAATRLPNKPLLDINGKPLVIHVCDQSKNAGNFDIYVAAGDKEIADAANEYGYKSILTDPNLKSGTDRVYSAYTQLPNKSEYKYIINVQGDMAIFNPSIISETVDILKKSNFDIATLCAETDLESAGKKSVVKPVFGEINENGFARALYFSRSLVPNGAEKFYHHVGIYGFTVPALEKFVSLSPSKLELTENLEQLRALENGMTIAIGITRLTPHSVDTPEDLEIVRKMVK